MEALIKLGIFLILVLIGFMRGRRNAVAHLIALKAEEQSLREVLIFATRYPDASQGPQDPILVAGNAVVSADYFRFLLASLRKFLGGRYQAYEDLNDRARRQAIVRMKQDALRQGARRIFNVRVETSRISHPREGGTPQVEVLAYGTAFVPAGGPVAQSPVRYEPGSYVEPCGPFNLMENPFSRNWVWVGFLCLLLSGLALPLDNSLSVQWRYTEGAPWWGFGILSGGMALWLAIRAGKAGVPAMERWVLAAVSLPILMGFLYFAVIHLNGIPLYDRAAQTYVADAQGWLKPLEGEGPVIDQTEHARYWQAQVLASKQKSRPEGQPKSQPDGTLAAELQVRLRAGRGLLGLAQFDLAPLRPRYEDWYGRQDRGKAKPKAPSP